MRLNRFQKDKVSELREKGFPIQQVAKQLCVSYHDIKYHWRQAKPLNHKGFSPYTISRFTEVVDRLGAEVLAGKSIRKGR